VLERVKEQDDIPMKLSRALAALFLASAASISAAQGWRYSVGVHDFAVSDVGSHTYGVNGSVSIDKRTESGRHLFGSFEFFLDEKDDLDSDHILPWWQFHVGTDGDFWRGDRLRVGWTANIDTRVNTVSAVERQLTALPAFVGSYEGQIFQASLEAGAGWFFLELDDDAPRELGYDRSALRNSTFAYAASANLRLKLSDFWSLSGHARGWWDSHRALQQHYQAALRVDVGNWIGGSIRQPALVLSADAYKYNLDVYNRPNLPPILRWNDDLMIRVAFETKW